MPQSLGNMNMPSGFKYREVVLRGMPHHERLDPFRLRHPVMDMKKRAKIFVSFDALKGFSEAIDAETVKAGLS